MTSGRGDGRSSTAYRKMRVRGMACVWCGSPAEVRDHEPALALHQHREQSGCCVVVPACAVCNTARGREAQAVLASIRKAKRAQARRKRVGVLAPRDDSLGVW